MRSTAFTRRIPGPDRSSAIHATHIDTNELTPATNVARHRFTDAMSGAATGVNIVTTDGAGGRFGLTVSAFASVSVDPPSLLVCINKRSPICAAIQANDRFCVNVLARDQDALAQTFAGRPTAGAAYEFRQGQWGAGERGSPVLLGAVASFECALASTATVGSHHIFLGRCAAVTYRPAPPLIYANRGYGQVCRNH